MDSLIVAAAQILFIDVPDHAAVDLAVRACGSMPRPRPSPALINGVLRNLARRRDRIPLRLRPVSLGHAGLARRALAQALRQETAHAIAARASREPTLDLSVKSDPQGWAERLGGMLLPTGSLRLRSHEPVAELPGYSDGEWWVQDAAAAIPARLLDAAGRRTLLDLCAAPGGKTAHSPPPARAGDGARSLGRAAAAAYRNLERLQLTPR